MVLIKAKEYPCQKKGEETMDHAAAMRWLDANRERLIQLSDFIWNAAEVGLLETKSAQAQIEMLEEEGFRIERGIAGMPTAFVAEWGQGQPVLAYLGEFDALPGLSQAPGPDKQPVKEGAPGHGCGHNLLGTAALGAAVAVKTQMEETGERGTVRYYGCPAEETLVGKVFMVRDGYFDDVDVVLDWHPGAINAARNNSSNAMNSARFTFHGRTAHAGGDPHNGRSALDAVELMNVAANYLREHIVEKARLHYVITDGGGEPNVVPDHAQVWYYVRAPQRHQVDEIYQRLCKIAEGACLMTETRYDVRLLSACYNILPNKTLTRLLHEHMLKVGPNQWNEEQLAFARRMTESFEPGQKEEALTNLRAPSELSEQLINDTILPWDEDTTPGGGSTDVGDVSWIAPTGRISVATGVVGQSGHSWQFAACSGMSIGHDGMLMASRILAGAGLELMRDADLREAARREWEERTADRPYRSPLQSDQVPPLDQLKGHH